MRPWLLGAGTAFVAGLLLSPAAATTTAAPAGTPGRQPAKAESISQLLSTPIGYSLITSTDTSASGLVVRAAMQPTEACPTLTTTAADGTTTSTVLSERAAPANTGSAYSGVLVCEAPVPAGATPSGTLTWADGRTLPVPTAIAPISQLGVIGDTGCRLVYDIQQACDDARRWPLAGFARDIAKAAPQALVHVGDYFYGDWDCLDPKQCGDNPPPAKGQPFMATAAGFVYQFLRPMAPALQVTPMLATIGNEEVCNNNGVAYYYFLDPRSDSSRTCDPVSRGGRSVAPIRFQPTYAVDLPLATGSSLRLVMTDSTQANDDWVTSWSNVNRPRYVVAADLATRAPAPQTWLVTHRPLFAVRPNWQCGFRCTPYSRKPSASFWVSADTAAAAQGLLDPYRLILSGHVHLNESVQVPGQPGQLVVGAGGTALDPGIHFVRPRHGQLATGLGQRMSAQHRPFPTLTSWFHQSEFAWATMSPQPQDGRWRVTYRGEGGRTTARCTLDGRAIDCR